VAMENVKKLTIGVPTYNGAQTIEKCLDSIAPQITADVELIVCNNCSTDATEKIVRQYLNKFPQLVYFRNSENIGMDRNFDLTVRKAAGEYVWILSDDDVIVDPKAVQKVLNVNNQTTNLGCIFANYENVDIPIEKDSLNIDGNTFFKITKFKNTLISSTIVNKKLWLSYDLSPYYGTYWTHIGYLVRANSTHKSAILRDELVHRIVYEQTERRWGKSGTFFKVGVDLAKIYNNLDQLGYDAEITKTARLYVKDKNLVTIPLAKAFGLNVDTDLIKDCIHVFGRYPSFWMRDLILLTLPKFIFVSAYKIYKFLKNLLLKRRR
jgi:glycosyltransferase involved in cell wall biosynthesis